MKNCEQLYINKFQCRCLKTPHKCSGMVLSNFLKKIVKNAKSSYLLDQG